MDENDPDEFAYKANFHEQFYCVGGVTLTPLNPIARIYGSHRPAPYEEIDLAEEINFEHLNVIIDAFYEINAELLGVAVKNTFQESDFAKVCQRPFWLEIQEHDHSRYAKSVAYLE